jgi:phenylalanyl-tRNA synthetase beta chain
MLCVMSVDSTDREFSAMQSWNLLVDALGIGAQVDQKSPPAGFHPGRSATLRRGKTIIGAIGEISPVVLKQHGIAGRVSCLELSLTTVLFEAPKPVAAKAVSRYPSSDVDLAFVVENSVAAADVHRAVRQGAGALAVAVDLFDVYRGKGVDAEARSLAFRIRLQAPDRTLTDDEVAAARQKCIDAAAKLGAQLRA